MNNMKSLYIAFIGQCSSSICAELKKLLDWDVLKISYNPFCLIKKLTTVCQAGGFWVKTDPLFEGFKQYKRFMKFAKNKNATMFHRDLSTQYEALIATNGKLPFGVNMMTTFIATNSIVMLICPVYSHCLVIYI